MNGIAKRTAFALVVLSIGGSSFSIAPATAFGAAGIDGAGSDAAGPLERWSDVIIRDGMTFRVVAGGEPDAAPAGVVLENGEGAEGDVEVPSSVEDADGARYGVIGVAPRAFMGNRAIRSIVFRDGPTSIGASAFRGCSSLERVELPRTLKALGVDGNGNASTFVGCASLSAIEVPGSVAVVPPDAFRQCAGLESVVLGEGVEEIGTRAFDLTSVDAQRAPGISLVSIPASVKRVGAKFLAGASGSTVLRFEGAVPPEFSPGAFHGMASPASIPRVEYPPEAVRGFAGLESALVREGIIEQAWFGDPAPSVTEPPAGASDEGLPSDPEDPPAADADRVSSEDGPERVAEGPRIEPDPLPSSSSQSSPSDVAPIVAPRPAPVDRAPERVCPSEAFADIDTAAWYHEPMDWAIRTGCLRGYGSGMMGPDDVVTRAMAVTVLSRIAGADLPGLPASTRFSDVDPSSWYARAVAWGQRERIVAGYGDGVLFGPDDPLTREQLAAILMRFTAARGGDTSSRSDLSRFSDSSAVSPWAAGAVEWSVANGYLLGFSDGELLGASAPVTRAQLAAVLMRYRALA